jgi:hypothetical protein
VRKYRAVDSAIKLQPDINLLPTILLVLGIWLLPTILFVPGIWHRPGIWLLPTILLLPVIALPGLLLSSRLIVLVEVWRWPV